MDGQRDLCLHRPSDGDGSEGQSEKSDMGPVFASGGEVKQVWHATKIIMLFPCRILLRAETVGSKRLQFQI